MQSDLIYSLERSLGFLCSGCRQWGRIYSGGSFRTELQMAESDGLGLRCDTGVSGIWLHLGYLGLELIKPLSMREEEESRMHPYFWPD